MNEKSFRFSLSMNNGVVEVWQSPYPRQGPALVLAEEDACKALLAYNDLIASVASKLQQVVAREANS